MLSIFKKEVSTFFNSLIGYIVIAVFLLLTSLVVWIYPDTNIMDYGFAEMDVFFNYCPYILIFLVSAITMRMFSEEEKSGTLELLLTKPVKLIDIILGKYFAALWIIVLAIAPTLVYYFSIYYLGNPKGNIDSASVVGSYFGLILLAAAFAAIGIFTSSITKNQVIAFISAAILCYFAFDGFAQLTSLFSGSFGYFLSYFSLDFHFDALGKGLLDSRNLIYLLSFSFVFIFMTYNSLNRKRQ